VALDAPNPFVDGAEDASVASVGYRYRKFELGDDVTLIVRCEFDGVQRSGTQDQYMTIKALNEFDPKVRAMTVVAALWRSGGMLRRACVRVLQLVGVDWRQKLDAQRGAVLATEIKNNNSKLARWTAQSLLAGTDLLKIGCVGAQEVHARVQPRLLSLRVAWRL
jgi:translation initiation factor 3 subunit D